MREDSLWLKIRDLYPYRSERKNSVGNRLYSKYPIERDTLLKDNQMAYGITCCQIKVMGRTGDHRSTLVEQQLQRADGVYDSG